MGFEIFFVYIFFLYKKSHHGNVCVCVSVYIHQNVSSTAGELGLGLSDEKETLS